MRRNFNSRKRKRKTQCKKSIYHYPHLQITTTSTANLGNKSTTRIALVTSSISYAIKIEQIVRPS